MELFAVSIVCSTISFSIAFEYSFMRFVLNSAVNLAKSGSRSDKIRSTRLGDAEADTLSRIPTLREDVTIYMYLP